MIGILKKEKKDKISCVYNSNTIIYYHHSWKW